MNCVTVDSRKLEPQNRNEKCVRAEVELWKKYGIITAVILGKCHSEEEMCYTGLMLK